ncbi:MFS transporter [Streptomyces sp. MBT57]|nr:MFS transporter [Streptomyces sp. MBT57]
MPFAVYVLGLAVFAQGTSEFMLSGLVSSIAADLGVPLSAAGLLTSAFAVGMVIGAPLMALFSRTWPRRRALLFFLAVFVAVHIAGALTPGYGVLLATRFVGAIANAGFWAVALTAAVAMVPDRLKGRATAVVVGGVTIACVVGVPAGAVLGERWGWRAAFWAVAAVSLPAFLAILRSVPGGPRPEAVPAPVSVRDELRVLTGPRLRPTLLTMALVQGATFCAFSYLEPPTAFVTYGMAALALGWSALALTAARPLAVLALIPLLGMLAFGTGTALITRVLALAPGAPTLAGAFSTSAFNLGAAVGPWAGGLALDAGLGHRAPVWVSAVLMASALAVAGVRRADGTVSGVRVT